MEGNYILSVCGRQLVNGSAEKIELQSSASYVLRNGTRYIAYHEYNPQDPAQRYLTTIKVDKNNIVTVLKGGEESHQLILEKGKRHKCEYHTPYGSITMGIYTDTVSIALDDRGGELTVRYSIDIESETVSSNELTINIREDENHVNSISNDPQS